MPRFPEWRTEHDAAKFPFEDRCTLLSDTEFTIPNGVFLDAAFYVRGGGDSVRLISVVIEDDRVTLNLIDDNEIELSGEFVWNSSLEHIRITDTAGRAAGLLVTEPLRMSALQAWGNGTHLFGDQDAVFVAGVSAPLPDVGVSGLVLDDGTRLTGDAILVADDGLMFSCDTAKFPTGCGDNVSDRTVVRLNAVGNPLFLRQRCEPSLFKTPRFLQSLVFQFGEKRIEIGPGDTGRVILAQVPVLVEDTVLRLSNITNGIRFEVVGERTDGGGNGG